MVDLTNRVLMRHLTERLHVPWDDVDIALALVRPMKVKNARWYDATEAAKALEAFYVRRIAENQQRYSKSGAAIYRRWEARSAERLARVREYLAELEGA